MSGDETLIVLVSLVGMAIPVAVLALLFFAVAAFVVGWRRAATAAGTAFLGAWLGAAASAYLPTLLLPGYGVSEAGRTLYPLGILAGVILGGAIGAALVLRRGPRKP